MGVRKHQIPLLHLAQSFVKVIQGAILFALGAPNIAIPDLVVESLTMIDPPVAHEDLRFGIGCWVGGCGWMELSDQFQESPFEAISVRGERLIVRTE